MLAVVLFSSFLTLGFSQVTTPIFCVRLSNLTGTFNGTYFYLNNSHNGEWVWEQTTQDHNYLYLGTTSQCRQTFQQQSWMDFHNATNCWCVSSSYNGIGCTYFQPIPVEDTSTDPSGTDPWYEATPSGILDGSVKVLITEDRCPNDVPNADFTDDYCSSGADEFNNIDGTYSKISTEYNDIWMFLGINGTECTGPAFAAATAHAVMAQYNAKYCWCLQQFSPLNPSIINQCDYFSPIQTKDISPSEAANGWYAGDGVEFGEYGYVEGECESNVKQLQFSTIVLLLCFVFGLLNC